MGSHIVDALVGRGHGVRVFDRRNVDVRNLAGSLGRIEFLGGDFLNDVDLAKAVSGIDVIVHLISTTLPKSSNDNPLYDVETNLNGTIKLLNLAREAGVKKIIFASSGGTVYGLPLIQPIPETHPTDPICSYGIAKLAIEKYLQLYNHLYELDYVVLRIANPYGERQNPDSGQGAVTTFLWKTLQGAPITIWGDGTVARDYFHIHDLVQAFVRVIEEPTPSRIYNLGSGKPHTLNDILGVIHSVTGIVPTASYTVARKMDIPVNYLNVSRARAELGWRATLGLEDGIARTWAALKASTAA